MYTLIEAKKETAKSVFFQAEHKELETLHTIEVKKEYIQGYLEYCGQNQIPAQSIENIMHEELTLDICQDIVKFGKEHNDYFVVGGTASQPSWTPSKMYHNAFRGQPYSNPSLLKFNLQRGYILVDGYPVKTA